MPRDPRDGGDRRGDARPRPPDGVIRRVRPPQLDFGPGLQQIESPEGTIPRTVEWIGTTRYQLDTETGELVSTPQDTDNLRTFQVTHTEKAKGRRLRSRWTGNNLAVERSGNRVTVRPVSRRRRKASATPYINYRQ